ncbi:hypothetical protein K438DRAFT_2001193 [Mycena galopus ATCC 62051]|nr:hypothetical protein K438DRAFT_2001193 [Mycena galopus ATCC 62051]
MNTDISGIGVRVSFYLQTLFMSCLAARSGRPEEITGSLFTLLFTNTAMAVTALILGFKQIPEISFHDALIVFYLLFLSWITVFLSLRTSADSANKDVQMLHFFSIIQSYSVFAFVFVLLITAPSFGSHPECNLNAVVVIFRPFSVLWAGRPVAWVLTLLIAVCYTALLVKEQVKVVARTVLPLVMCYRMQVHDPEAAAGRPPRHNCSGDGAAGDTAEDLNLETGHEMPTYGLNIAWHMILEITVLLILWSLSVMNTELLIRWTHFAPSDDSQSQSQFGQVLPMFLALPPLISMVNAFREHGLRLLPK